MSLVFKTEKDHERFYDKIIEIFPKDEETGKPILTNKEHDAFVDWFREEYPDVQMWTGWEFVEYLKERKRKDATNK